jgi:hypothetical protein
MISRVYRPRHVTRKCSETAGTAFKAGGGAARARPPVIKTRGKLNISFRSTRAGGWEGGREGGGRDRLGRSDRCAWSKSAALVSRA